MLDSHNHFNILKKWASSFEGKNTNEQFDSTFSANNASLVISYDPTVSGIEKYTNDYIFFFGNLNLSDLFEAINEEIKEAGLCKV